MTRLTPIGPCYFSTAFSSLVILLVFFQRMFLQKLLISSTICVKDSAADRRCSDFRLHRGQRIHMFTVLRVESRPSHSSISDPLERLYTELLCGVFSVRFSFSMKRITSFQVKTIFIGSAMLGLIAVVKTYGIRH